MANEAKSTPCIHSEDYIVTKANLQHLITQEKVNITYFKGRVPKSFMTNPFCSILFEMHYGQKYTDYLTTLN